MRREPGLGIIIMIGAMVGFALRDSAAKFLVLDITPLQIIWVQFTATFLVLAAVSFPRHGLRAFWPTPEFLQLWRGLAAVGGTGFYYWALYFLPLVDVAAMVLIAPLVVTVLSPLLLNEQLGVRRAIAVLVGFAGVLIILQPGFSGDLAGYVIAFLAGVFFGINYIANRMVGHLHPPLVGVAHNVLVGVVLLAPATYVMWVNIPPDQWLLFFWFLLAGLAAQTFLVTCFRYGPANVIAPFQYTFIIMASIASYLIFGTLPGPMTYLGAALITGAGLYVGLRETRLARIRQRS